MSTPLYCDVCWRERKEFLAVEEADVLPLIIQESEEDARQEFSQHGHVKVEVFELLLMLSCVDDFVACVDRWLEAVRNTNQRHVVLLEHGVKAILEGGLIEAECDAIAHALNALALNVETVECCFQRRPDVLVECGFVDW